MVWRRLSKIKTLSASINRASGMAMGGLRTGSLSM